MADRREVVRRAGEGERIDVLGEVAVVKVSAAESGGSITVVEVSGGPGGGAPPHRHTTFEEVFCVLEGEIEVMADGARTVLRAGDTAVIPRGVVHAYTNVGAGPTRAIVTMSPGGIEGMFREFEALVRRGAGFDELAAAGLRYGTELIPPPAAGPAAEPA